MKPALDADHPAETPGIHHPHPTLTILIPNQNPTPGQCSFWEIHKESWWTSHGYAQSFPKVETYGLTSRLRRAAVSVPSNIAEGQARLSTGEFRQFLGNARGSLMEVETQILIARGLGYLEQNQSEALLNTTAEVGRMLNGLLASQPSRK